MLSGAEDAGTAPNKPNRQHLQDSEEHHDSSKENQISRTTEQR